MHSALVDIAYKWILRNCACGAAFKELYTLSNGEYPDVIGFGSNCHSVLIEVKISRSDFLRDKKKFVRQNPDYGMGSFRFYCAPIGVLKKEDMPPGWGLILVDAKKVVYVYNPYGKITEPYPTVKYIELDTAKAFQKNIKAEHGLMYSVLRRLAALGHTDVINKNAPVPDQGADVVSHGEN